MSLKVPPAYIQNAPWWNKRRQDLIERANAHSPCFIYNEEQLNESLFNWLNLARADRLFHSVAANPHPDILRKCLELGLYLALEGDADRQAVAAAQPDLPADRFLHTPSALDSLNASFRCAGTVASLGVTEETASPALLRWPTRLSEDKRQAVARQLLERRSSTTPPLGIALGLPDLNAAALRDAWESARPLLADWPQPVVLIDAQGGLLANGDNSESGLEALGETIEALCDDTGGTVWLAPGRLLVSDAGVWLGRVRRVSRDKEGPLIEIESGFQPFIPPSLYGSDHEVVNLSRLEDPSKTSVTLIEMDAEPTRPFALAAHLPETQVGDVLAFTQAGASGYGLKDDRPGANATELFLKARAVCTLI